MISHVDESGRPRMVDVSEKAVTSRTAHARAEIVIPAAVAEQMRDGDLHTKKGPVFHTAIIAGVMAAKKTSELIPFCHPLMIEKCNVEITMPASNRIQVDCTVSVHGRTGVEMEAITGSTVAAITIYDMCKALSHDIVIEQIRLVEKRGGKSDYALP